MQILGKHNHFSIFLSQPNTQFLHYHLIKPQMKVFEASRLSEGNKIMPNKVSIDNFGVTLTVPGLFSGKEKTLTFHEISSVEVQSPMIGFSTVKFKTLGWDELVVKGFSEDDAKDIKKLVQAGIMSVRGGANYAHGQFHAGAPQYLQVDPMAEAIKAQAELEEAKLRAEETRREKQERAQKAQKYKDEGKYLVAWLLEIDPTYNWLIGTLLLVLCISPVQVIGIPVTLFFLLAIIRDAAKFSWLVYFIASIVLSGAVMFTLVKLNLVRF